MAVAACAAQHEAQPEVQARALALADPAKGADPDVVWVLMKDQANLDQARTIADWGARGTAVRDALLATATDKQQAIQRYLVSRSVNFEPFWIVNALRVRADAATVEQLKNRPDVAEVSAERVYHIPDPQPSAATAAAAVSDGLPWGLESIRAPEAWRNYGSHGEGIVIGSIDSGAQFDHPALVRQYRGHRNGSFDHNYNWHDPSRVCGNPSLAPCDNTAHGTHTLGTMVGLDESGAHPIGVAPGARWISAKGCEDRWCSIAALLSAAQWMLSPTDLNGLNQRPDLRPNIVSNSWSSSPGDTYLEPVVRAWVAAGMFPVFSTGNDGPTCGTANSPSDYPESYSVAAYDATNTIALFSGRGSGNLGATKPNIAAPGVGVLSSVPGNGYFAFDGTSMAAPHVSGAVALLWSAVPALRGDITTTRALLDTTAVDAGDWNCGGDKTNNATWGEGRLDVYAALQNAEPQPSRWQLLGVVTSDAVPLANATVTARAAGQPDRFITTRADGTYQLALPTGSYSLEARAFGFVTQTVAEVQITQGIAIADISLEPAQLATISGAIVDDKGAVVPFASVTAVGAPLEPVFADGQGKYTLRGVPLGNYVLSVDGYGCYQPKQVPVAVQSALTQNITLSKRYDKYGYGCQLYSDKRVTASQPLLTAGDDQSKVIELPFPFVYYGKEYKSASVSINGALSFQAKPFVFANAAIPSAVPPNAAIYALWHDYVVGGASSVLTQVHGAAPERIVVFEWRNVRVFPGMETDKSFNFSIVLHETGQITMQYGPSDAAQRYGELATIGIEDETGSDGLMYSLYRSSIVPGMSLRYSVAQAGLVRGTLKDANDGQPLAGVAVAAMRGMQQLRRTTTDKQGNYLLQVPAGNTTIVVSAKHYAKQERAVTVVAAQTTKLDIALQTAVVEIEPNAIELVVSAGKSKLREFSLKNVGSAPLRWAFQQTGSDELEPGDVRKTLRPPVLLPWGVGMAENLWVSDLFGQLNVELTNDGVATGRVWPPEWPNLSLDMAYDSTHELMCQVDFSAGYSIGLPCWDPNTGKVEASISGDFAWTQVPQRGLAYVASDDTFYIGGPDRGVIYHIAGLSHDHPGEILDQCQPPDRFISGLAWNASKRVLWQATNSPSDTLFELNPDDCSVLSAIAHPAPGYNGAGLELDARGDLWMVAQSLGTVYLVASGVPTFTNVPWLSTTPNTDTLAPGESATVTLTVNTSGLAPGAYKAAVFLESDAARAPSIRIPVSLIVTDYQRAIDSGSDLAYIDSQFETWSADRRYVSGEWGYVNDAQAVSSERAVAGSTDPALYQSLLRDPGGYRFDNVPNGMYEVELRFATPAELAEEQHEFDVIVEDELVLPAYDPAYRSGLDHADDHTFYVPVTDGQLDVRFSARSGRPFINALRVTHRPDL